MSFLAHRSALHRLKNHTSRRITFQGAGHIMAARYWDKPNSRSWTGDVWKILPILHRHRPDLKVEVIDCSPTGLVLLSNLDPENQTLQAAYASILDEWNHQSLDDYGLEKMRADFPLVSATEYLAR